MKKFWSLITNKNFFPLFIVLLFGVLAARSLIFESGYFNMHDDLQMMRQLEMEKCFLDGQIPCRWIPDMGYGFGFPLFNFYPPLPYLTGEIFRILGFSFVETAKLLFALAFIASGITMYYLAKEFFGRIGGALSAVFYIWAPYHSVDIYVRGAMNEAWALIFFPLIFWSSYKLINSKEKEIFKWVLWLSASYAALFLSHNLMVLIFTPFFAVWVLIHLWLKNEWKKIPYLLLSGIWALALSAFFTFPALFENKFTQIKGQLTGYYDYTAHFVTLRQLLITRFWGYGPSVWLEDDRMSFQIGHLHWIFSIIIFILLIIRFIFKKEGFFSRFKTDKILTSSAFLFAMGWFAAFMTHSRSIRIYQIFPQLGYVQFSWRFLTLVIFAFSFLIGYLPGVLANLKSGRNFLVKFLVTPPEILLFLILSVFIVIFDWNYFKPEYGKMGPLTDQQKFSGRAWELQQTSGIYDYLPVYAKEAPKEKQKVLAELKGGEGVISGMEQGTYWGRFSIDVKSESAKVMINIFEFPNWKVFVDSKETPHYLSDKDLWGRMWVDIPNGRHNVYVQFFNTPIRTISNLVSLASIVVFGFVIFKIKKSKV